MDPVESPQPDEYDSPWKDVIESYFPAFMEFFFPDAYADIDWTQPYEFLDKELMEVVRDAELGKRFADKLVKVQRKSGTEVWVLVHIEVQGQASAEFPERMYVYNYRLFDKYGRRIASLAILADGSPGWRPDRFEYDIWGSRAGLHFRTAKLSDFGARWEELEASQNPFAHVVMAHLKTQATRNVPEERMAWKLRIVRGLYERGYTRQDVLELFRVIDWMMHLPEELDRAFEYSVQQYEGEQAMKYVTSIERIAIERGREKGRAEGREEGRAEGGQSALRQALVSVLLVRFQRVPESARTRIEELHDTATLHHLVEVAAGVESLEEFERQLPSP